MAFRVVRRCEQQAVPWRNGGGITRELARRPDHGEFLWRLSVADVEKDGPFSEFPGVDRILVLLCGDGMSLHFVDGEIRTLERPLEYVTFAGERTVSAELLGGPTVDLNLMWRRGEVSVTKFVVPCSAVHLQRLDGATVLVVVGDGSAGLPDGSVLEVGDALIADATVPVLSGDGTAVCFVVR